MMETNLKTLTLGIVTYNNPSGLRAILQCALSQISGRPELAEQVELLISDNSTVDDTKNMIASEFGDVPNLTYIKNEKNLGYDRNVDQVFSRAQGRFCWTFSDNDIIADGGIAYILSFLKEHPSIAHVIIHPGMQGDPKFFENTEALLADRGYTSFVGGLVSRNIFNMSMLPQRRNKYYGNYWFHLSVALEMGARREIALVSDVLEPKGDAECRWAGGGTTFTTYTNLHGVAMNLGTFGYSEAFLRGYHQAFLKGLPHQVVTAKLYGLTLTKKSVKRLYEHTKNDKAVFIVSLLLLATPVFVLKAARYVWRKL